MTNVKTRWVLGLAMLAAARTAGAAFPVGTTTRTLVTTSVSGTPRTLDTIVWYPAVPRTGTPEALGLRDAKVRRGRFPLIVFMHGTCGRPDEATYLTKAPRPWRHSHRTRARRCPGRRIAGASRTATTDRQPP